MTQFSFVRIFKRLLAFLIAIACSLTSGAFGDFAAGYEPLQEDCQLNFAVIADIHMTDETARRDMLALGLCDMDFAKNKLDALVIAGDMTDHGRSEQYAMLADAFSKYTPADNIIMAVGNHDTWNDEIDDAHEFSESERLFIEYNRQIANREIDKMYYSTVINGYTFIVMSSDGTSTDAYISAEQLAWLDSELAAAAADGNPIFVVSHWPVNQTHGLPLTWLDNPVGQDGADMDLNEGGFGEQSDAVEAILQKYENVFLISGHLHNGIASDSIYDYASVEQHGNITSVNLPSYMYPGMKGSPANGNGFVFEVYENEIIIRARSFSGGVWYQDDIFTIALK